MKLRNVFNTVSGWMPIWFCLIYLKCQFVQWELYANNRKWACVCACACTILLRLKCREILRRRRKMCVCVCVVTPESCPYKISKVIMNDIGGKILYMTILPDAMAQHNTRKCEMLTRAHTHTCIVGSKWFLSFNCV